MNRREHAQGRIAGKQNVRPIVQVYFLAQSWFQKIIRALQACFVGLWLGVLPPDKLYATIEEYYTRSGKSMKGHHDYSNKNYNNGGLFDWESAAIARYFEGCERLLVLGAGGGREVLALLRLGYRVDGFESHTGLAMAANDLIREEGFDSSVQWLAPDEGPSTTTTYDGIIVGWGMYMSIQTRERRVAFLRQLRTQIKPQDPILVSFFARPGAAEYFISALVANAIRRVLRREFAEVGDWLGPFYVHHFTRDEVTDELAAGGFDTVHFDTAEYGHAVAIAV